MNNLGIALEIMGFILLLPISKNLMCALILKGIIRDLLKQRKIKDLFISTITGISPEEKKYGKIQGAMLMAGIILIIRCHVNGRNHTNHKWIDIPI